MNQEIMKQDTTCKTQESFSGKCPGLGTYVNTLQTR